LLARGANSPTDFEGIGMLLMFRLEAGQLELGFGEVAQADPSGGCGNVVALWCLKRFHTAI